jgi:tetratricopeptide (TPR) repeat protein
MGTTVKNNGDSSRATVVLTFGQLWQIPMFVFGLAVLGTVWATKPIWNDPDGLRFQRELNQSRKAIESGTGLQDATQVLAHALIHAAEHPKHKGEVQFLLGCAYVRLAESANNDRKKDLWQQALRYFDQAKETGVPDTDALVLVYHSARARYYTDSSQEALRRIIFDLSVCVDKMPSQRWEAYDILTQCYLRLTPTDNKGALTANEHQLQLPLEDERLLDPVRLLRGELLLKAGDRDEARRTLSRIGNKAPAALIQRARFLRAQSFQDDGVWREASGLWKDILAEGKLPPAEKSHVLYSLGLCFKNLDNMPEEERIWLQIIAQRGEEAPAAELHLAELYVRTKRFAEAASSYEKILAKVEKPEDYKYSKVPASKIVVTLEIACQEAQKAGALNEASRLAKAFGRIASHESGARMVAKVAEAKANASGDPKDFEEAGMAYEAAASAVGTGSQESYLLWSATRNLLAAKNYKYARGVIEHYISLKPPLDGLTEAYYRLGEVEQALADQSPDKLVPPNPDEEKPSKAEESWRKGYELGGSFSSRSGVRLALALQKRNKLEEAEQILQKIVEQPRTDEAQEEALYSLANIIFLRANYAAASNRWKQALNLYPYPTSRFALQARFQLGECNRRQAEAYISTGNPVSRIPNTSIRNHNSFLFEAVGNFTTLIAELDSKRNMSKLTDSEAELLCKGLFALAECLSEQAQYGEARIIYERLAADHADRIESWDALKKLYSTYIVDNPINIPKATEALTELEKTLSSLPDAAFADRLVNRKACADWLAEQKRSLDKLRPFTIPGGSSRPDTPAPSSAFPDK